MKETDEAKLCLMCRPGAKYCSGIVAHGEKALDRHLLLSSVWKCESVERASAIIGFSVAAVTFGTCLLVIADLGFGDTLQWARFLGWAAARCPEIALCCPPSLVEILRPLLPAGSQIWWLNVARSSSLPRSGLGFLSISSCRAVLASREMRGGHHQECQRLRFRRPH
jgi:hypothetical protein